MPHILGGCLNIIFHITHNKLCMCEDSEITQIKNHHGAVWRSTQPTDEFQQSAEMVQIVNNVVLTHFV